MVYKKNFIVEFENTIVKSGSFNILFVLFCAQTLKRNKVFFFCSEDGGKPPFILLRPPSAAWELLEANSVSVMIKNNIRNFRLANKK